MKKRYNFTYTIAAIVATLVFIFSSYLVQSGGRNAFAATATSTAYEQSNVLDDLKGSTVNGKEFDLVDYPYDDTGKPQVISFIEFGYSCYSNMQYDFGLYVYVYNPQGVVFDENTDRNKIEFSYVENEYDKYSLQFLNYSIMTGYEGRFYKFKVVLKNEQKTDILKSLKQDERIYEIVGIELSVKTVVTDYPCLQTYTYSGYALGYGSGLSTENTLTCKVDGVDKYLSLGVHSTYYRPEYTNGKNDYTQDTLHSVYFSVPNEVLDEYGDLTEVHATWLNAFTSPIFVTGNKTIYNALLKSVWENNGVPSSDLDYCFGANVRFDGRDYFADFSFNDRKNPNYKMFDNATAISSLYYLFLAENGDADNYTLSSEKLLTYMKSYSVGHELSELVNDKYFSGLFSYVDSEFTDIHIPRDKEYVLTSQKLTQSFWEKYFTGGKHSEFTNIFDEIKAIHEVVDDDFRGDPTFICNSLYIAESDYDNFRTFYEESLKRDKTVYLFRYYQSDYECREVTEYKYKSSWGISNADIDKVDTNAYFAQEWLQLDFDIIDLTFTKNGVSTVIPVVMSPVDMVAGVTPPVYSSSDNDWRKWLAVLISLVVLVVILILSWPIISPVVTVIVKGILWLITAPFKALAKLFKRKKE